MPPLPTGTVTFLFPDIAGPPDVATPPTTAEALHPRHRVRLPDVQSVAPR